MMLAKLAASRSTCVSRPTGAVIVKDRQILATGYNGSLHSQPHCIDDGKCFRRGLSWPEEMKYDMCRSAHAEANTIALAAKKGVSVEGATIKRKGDVSIFRIFRTIFHLFLDALF